MKISSIFINGAGDRVKTGEKTALNPFFLIKDPSHVENSKKNKKKP